MLPRPPTSASSDTMVALPADTRYVVDQTGYRTAVPQRPQRIVSLVPSQTELLYELGLADRLVGCTRYCLHPDRARQELAVVGGTKQIDPQTVLALEPDLVIGNKEENDVQSIEPLRNEVATWLSDIATLPEALAMIESLGDICGAAEAAVSLAAAIRHDWAALDGGADRTVAYLIWRKPYMAVARETFIDDVLTRLGFRNAFSDVDRYPETTLDELRLRQPDIVMLSTEPFPFAESHVSAMRAALPEATVVLVDGEMFSWYGSRLSLSPAYFESLLATIDTPESIA